MGSINVDKEPVLEPEHLPDVANLLTSVETASVAADKNNNINQKNYMKILEDVDHNVIKEGEGGGDGVEGVEGAFDDAARKACQLYEDVVTPGDALLDLKVMHRLSLLCRKRAETRSTNEKVFRAEEFVDRLVEEMGGVARADGGGVARVRTDQWAKLGEWLQ